MKLIQVFTLLVLVFSIKSYGQSSCNKNDFNLLKLPDGILISSEIDPDINSGPDTPVIEKYSTEGELIWHTTADNLSGYNNLSNIRLFYFSDEYIYALLTIRDTHHNSGLNQQVWKLNPDDGAILWKTSVYETDATIGGELVNYNNIIEYDGQSLLLNLLLRDNNGGSSDGVEILSINKDDGTSSLLYSYEGRTIAFLLEKDSQGNLIYYTGDYLIKINKTDFNSIIWKKKAFNSSIGDIHGILFLDKEDNIYAFNTAAASERVNLYKYNAFDGAEQWVVQQISNSSYGVLSQFKIFGDHIYLTTSGRYGQFDYVPESPKILKIHVDTGEVLWVTNELMNILGNDGSDDPISNQYVNSFDIDCNGDIYSTGFYQSQGNGEAKSGAWGVMKVDGKNGKKIKDLTITNSIEDVDLYSLGKYTFVFENQPIFYGNLQNGEENYKEVFVLTDSDISTVKSINNFCETITLSNSDEFFFNELNIYPNPTKGVLNINTTTVINNLSLYSLSGKNIKSWENNMNSINLENIASGIYLLYINSDKGHSVRKIIKK